MPLSTINKKKNASGAGISIKQKPKVSEEQSKDIMNNLFNQLDSNQADELEDINSSAIIAELNKPIAFNKEDQLYNKYNITVGQQNKEEPNEPIGTTHQSANPFSKKRKLEEISSSARTEKQQD